MESENKIELVNMLGKCRLYFLLIKVMGNRMTSLENASPK